MSKLAADPAIILLIWITVEGPTFVPGAYARSTNDRDPEALPNQSSILFHLQLGT